MTYLVHVYIEYNNGKAAKKAIYTMATADEAIATFHSQMGSAMMDATVAHILCLAFNSEGGIYKNEAYTRPVVEETVEE